MLKTNIVKECSRTKEKTICALLDSGSQGSYISSKSLKDIKGCENNFKCEVESLDQIKICNSIPKLENLNVLDSYLDAPIDIELLLRADIFGQLLTDNAEYLSNGRVVIETILGWTIMGKYCNDKNSYIAGFSDFTVPDLWELDR